MRVCFVLTIVATFVLLGVGPAAATDGAAWAARARQMLNTGHVNERSRGAGVVEIFLRGAEGDVNVLRRLTGRNNEQMYIGVHLSLLGRGARSASRYHGTRSR